MRSHTLARPREVLGILVLAGIALALAGACAVAGIVNHVLPALA
jgi:hypothetical protein